MAQQKRTQLVSVKMRVGSPASLSGLRIRHCHELGSLEEEEVRTQTYMEGRPCEDTGRRRPSTRPGERPLEGPALPTPGAQTPASRTGGINVCGLRAAPPTPVVGILLRQLS